MAAILTAFSLSATVALAQDAADDTTTTLAPIKINGGSKSAGTVVTDTSAATKTDTPLIETPQSVSVVTSGQMIQQGARTVSQGLSYTPGLFAEQRLDGLYDGLFIRGFGGFGGLADFNKFLDGLALPTAQYLAVPSIDPYTLDSIAVLKGPTSVMYGGASPGGVVDMVSKKPTGDTFGEVGLTVGNRNRIESFFDVGGLLDDAGAIQYRFAGIGRLADTQVDHIGQQKHVALAPSITLSPDADTKLTVLLNYENDPGDYYASWVPAAGTVLPSVAGRISRSFYSGDPSDETLCRRQFSVGYEFEHHFDDGVIFRQNARFVDVDQSYNGLTVNYQDPIGATPSTINRWATDTAEKIADFNIDNQLEGEFDTGTLHHRVLGGVTVESGKSDWLWKLGNATAIDYNDPTYDFDIGSKPLSVYNDQTVRSQKLGTYLQDQIKVGNLSLLIGGRHDWSWSQTDDRLHDTRTDQSDAAFSGRLGVSYLFDDGIAPYATYSTSFEPILGTDANGDAYKPSKGRQVEAGVKFQPLGMDAFVTLAAFDINQTNVRTLDSTLNGYIQTGAVRSRGFEAEAHASVTDNIDLIASYAFVDAEVSKDADSSIVGNAPVSVPRNMASLWGNYHVTDGALDGLTAGLGARYVGASEGDADNSFKVPSAVLFDAALNYDFSAARPTLKGMSASLNVRNLFDKDYISSCFSSGGCFFGEARTVTATLKYRW